MSRKRENVRQCKAIRQLIDDNKYTKALELIDAIPLEEVGSLDDLYRYAELYEKAERMDKKKEIFYHIYHRTHSRYMLNRLLRLTIRMGDMEEARELYFAYEVAGPITLDTFELRYLLAKAEGEPPERLIQILEELKKEEYTEEWGFRLACLYEKTGQIDKCIQECKDLKLWFGEGKIVDRAMQLLEHCENPAVAEPEELEETIEKEMPERREEYESSETEEIEEEPQENEDVDEASESYEEIVQEPETESEEEEEVLDPDAPLIESVGEVKVVAKRKKKEKPLQKPDNVEELLEEKEEDISDHGILYRTLKSAMNHVRYGDKMPHFVFAGGEERIVLAVAKRVAKELNKVGYVSVRSIVKITAEKLNQIDLSEQAGKIAGGCMLVTDASELTRESVEKLKTVMEQEDEKVVVMLAGPFDEMDCFLDIYPDLAEKLVYKVRM